MTTTGTSLSDLGNEALLAFEKLAHSLARDSPAQLDPVVLESEKQRFQLWAINLGLYHPGHSSLDYRLRDNETIRSFTTSLLVDLREALDEIRSQIWPDSENVDNTLLPPGASDEGHAASDEKTPGTNPIVTGVLLQDDASLIELSFEDVTESIDELLKLASQIRSPSSRKFRTNVDLYKHLGTEFRPAYVAARDQMGTQGIEQIILRGRNEVLSEHGQDQVLQVTEEDGFLVRRLKNANHARRQQFEYWKRFRSKSAKETAKALKLIPIKDQGQSEKETVRQDKQGITTMPTGPQSEVTRSLLSSVAIIPRDFEFRDDRSTMTDTSRGLTIHGPSGQTITWPQAPSNNAPGKPFECPYCFFLCPSKHLKDIAWRVHLKHDIRPYICTYADCPAPDVLYDNRDEWLRHEQWTHQRVWRCPEHPQLEFTEQSSYKSHVKAGHTERMENLLSPALVEAQKFTLKTIDRPCPFCHADFEDITKMQEHVASHLETIALLSLPNLDDLDQDSMTEGASSNAANRNAAGSRTRDFEDEDLPSFAENSGALLTPSPMDNLQFEQGLASLPWANDDTVKRYIDNLTDTSSLTENLQGDPGMSNIRTVPQDPVSENTHLPEQTSTPLNSKITLLRLIPVLIAVLGEYKPGLQRHNIEKENLMRSIVNKLQLLEATVTVLLRHLIISSPADVPVLVLLPLNGIFERKEIKIPFFPDSLRVGRETSARTSPKSYNGFFDAPVLSRQHAKVYADRLGKIWIKDTKSSNGTFVNGNRLSSESRESEPYLLHQNDHLQLGTDLVAHDEQTIVHHKVSAKVEQAGISEPPKIKDEDLPDLLAKHFASFPLSVQQKLANGLNSCSFGIVELIGKSSLSVENMTLNAKVEALNERYRDPGGITLGSLELNFSEEEIARITEHFSDATVQFQNILETTGTAQGSEALKIDEDSTTIADPSRVRTAASRLHTALRSAYACDHSAHDLYMFLQHDHDDGRNTETSSLHFGLALPVGEFINQSSRWQSVEVHIPDDELRAEGLVLGPPIIDLCQWASTIFSNEEAVKRRVAYLTLSSRDTLHHEVDGPFEATIPSSFSKALSLKDMGMGTRMFRVKSATSLSNAVWHLAQTLWLEYWQTAGLQFAEADQPALHEAKHWPVIPIKVSPARYTLDIPRFADPSWSVFKDPILARLGAELVEMALGVALEDQWLPRERKDGTALAHLATARRLLPEVSSEFGYAYADTVRFCLDRVFGFDTSTLQFWDSFYTNVVVALMEIEEGFL